MSTNEPIQIDVAKLQAEIANLPKDQLREQLLGMRVRQKKTQLKQAAKGNSKLYAAKQREKFNLMKAAAIEAGIWDELNEEANKKAEAEFDAETETVETTE